MELFNNRELALIIWFLIIFAVMLSKENLRRSLLSVFKAMFNIQIIVLFGAMGLYVFMVVLLLNKLNLWTSSFIKDTFLWIFITGCVLLLKINKSSGKEGYFKSLFWDAIKISLLFEFVVNFYTFSLLGEFVLQFVLVIIGLIKVIVERNERFRTISVLINYIFIGFSIYLIIYIINNILIGFQGLVTEENLKALLLSPLLTIAYIPFLYAIALFFAYDEFFRYLGVYLKADDSLAIFAKRRIFIFCNLNLSKFNNFVKENRVKLYHLHNREELFQLFQDFENKQ